MVTGPAQRLLSLGFPVARGATQILSGVAGGVLIFVGAGQYLVGQKQSRENQFLRRFLVKISRPSAEQQQREIREEWFNSGWKKDFCE